MSSTISGKKRLETKVIPKPKKPRANNDNNVVTKLEKRTKTAEEKLLKMQKN